MTLNVFVVFLLTAGAVALVLIDKALGPENKRFPCAHWSMHWAIRLYALASFYRAAVMLSAIRAGTAQEVSLDVVLGALAMAATHLLLLTLLLRARLPVGVWPRLELRFRAAKSSTVNSL